MQPLFLNCLTPLAIVVALTAATLLSMRRWPALWPEPVLDAGIRVETWSLSRVERARLWLWPQPDEPLGALQRRLRQISDSFIRWSDVPRNRLTLVVASGSLVAVLVGLIGILRPHGTFLNQAALPLVLAASTVYSLDALNRRRADLLDKEHLLGAFGSRDNFVALDASRTVVGRSWHRDGSLANGSFEHANLRGLAMARARLRSSSFMYADLRNADLMFSDLSNARMGSADLRNIRLNFSSLDSASLAMADLSGASLGRCSLRNAHLEGANLCGTFLKQSDLSGAYLEQAIYDAKTVWPDGFTPPEYTINWDRLSDTERDWFRQWRWYVA